MLDDLTVELLGPDDYSDILQVLNLRNTVRMSFTRHTDFITPREQLAWFNRERPTLWVWKHDDSVVGYALITVRDQQTWISLAVDPSMQGKGLGTEIYRDMSRYRARAEIWEDNLASLRAAEKAGYTVVGSDDGKVVMEA